MPKPRRGNRNDRRRSHPVVQCHCPLCNGDDGAWFEQHYQAMNRNRAPKFVKHMSFCCVLCEKYLPTLNGLQKHEAARHRKDISAATHVGVAELFPWSKLAGKDFGLEPVFGNRRIKLPDVVWDMIEETVEGLESGNHPVRSSEGTGGTYFMSDSSGERFISVFKPIDEEPMAVNNPGENQSSIDEEGLKRGTRVGEGAFREVAACLLDHPEGAPRKLYGYEEGLAGVPPTIIVEAFHRGFNNPPGGVIVKIGSLQKFMENQGSCEDIGPGVFPTDSVHKISVLDIRLANANRHAGNLLWREEGGQTVLIPIDHGYCLPEIFEDVAFEWLYWPQARKPFAKEVVNYIKSLDAAADISLLEYHGWQMPPKCAQTLLISTMLLKKGVERGFTAYDIGNIMCRNDHTKESLIEEIIREARSVLPDSTEDGFLDTVSKIMDRHLGEIAALP